MLYLAFIQYSNLRHALWSWHLYIHQIHLVPFISVRCSQLDGNGSQIKRTVLHDLYEKQRQSPWYDNLCRPVTDLLPLIASGVRGVTSNPAVIIFILFSVATLFLVPMQLWTCFFFLIETGKRNRTDTGLLL